MLKIRMPARTRDAAEEALETMRCEERYGGGVASREQLGKIPQERALKGRSFGRGRDRTVDAGGRDPGQ